MLLAFEATMPKKVGRKVKSGFQLFTGPRTFLGSLMKPTEALPPYKHPQRGLELQGLYKLLGAGPTGLT